MADDSKMHSGGSGEYLTSTDGRTFDGAGKVDVDGGRTPGARTNAYLDISRIRQEFGFEPAYSVTEGVADYFDWLRAGNDK